MGYKYGSLFIALLGGILAAPPVEIDNDLDFYHTDLEARIVGGTQAPSGSVPYMVAMTTGLMLKSFICGGSLITSRTVLTAAHCIDAVFSRGSLLSSLRVTVGTNRWNSGGSTYSISRNITHQQYTKSIIKNDIGFLIVSAPVTLDDRTKVVSLSFDHIGGGMAARIAGWGKTRVSGGSLSPKLLELRVDTISGEQCQKEVEQAGRDFNIQNVPPVEPEIEICTLPSPNHGICSGDSGSALVRVDQGSQIGIVSWGFRCAHGVPDIFTRISGFTDWISENIEF